MPTVMSEQAIEGATFAIDITFSDEDGAAVIPKAGLKWSLTDLFGNVVNNRADITIEGPASTVTIVLSGADLALPDPDDNVRVLTIEGTYDGALGTDLPLVDEARFTIVNLRGV